MKGFISVFALSARAALFKILGIIAIMAAAETGVFITLLRKYGQILRVEEILNFRFFTFAALTGFVLTACLPAFALRRNGRGFPAYTIARLSISERQSVFACSLYSLCMLLIFAAVQILLLWSFCRLYTAQTASADAAHMAFLAFTGSSLAGWLLPMPISFNALLILLPAAALSLAAGYGAAGRSLFPFGFILLTAGAKLMVQSVEMDFISFFASCAAVCFIPISLNAGNTALEEPADERQRG